MPVYLCNRGTIGKDGICSACGRKHGPEIQMTAILEPEMHKKFGDYLRKHGQAMVRGVEVDDGTHTKSKA